MKALMLGLLTLLILTAKLSSIGITSKTAQSPVVVNPGESIQNAINNASENTTVLVKNGTYTEQVIINKTVQLIGENANGVILDGKGENTFIINIIADNVYVEGFTIKNSSSQLGSFNVQVFKAQNTVLQNCRIEQGYYGVLLTNANASKIFNNQISDNIFGITLRSNSESNTISGNTMTDNIYGIYLDSSHYNSIFHNNFMNNTYSEWTDGSQNNWGNDYPHGGNYWSNYNGTDQYTGAYQNVTGSDGLGDSPYKDLDAYPYIHPLTIESYILNGITYYFMISTNLVIYAFNYYPDEAKVNFTVKGISETQGSVRVMLPKTLLWVNSPEEWIVKIGNETINPQVEEDLISTHMIFFIILEHAQKIKTVSINGYTHPKTSGGIDPLIFAAVLAMVLIIIIGAITLYHKHRSQNKPYLSNEDGGNIQST